MKRWSFLLIPWLAVQTWGYLTQAQADFDLWGYLAFGRLWWEGEGFPYRDVFSYLPTKSMWVYHEWLTGVVFYALYVRVGPAGLQVLKYVLGLFTVFLVYRTARLNGGGRAATVLALFLIADPLAAGFPPLRAQAFTYFFFALFLWILESYRQTGRIRWLVLIPPLFVPWANLHGGFLAGLGLLGLYGPAQALARRPVIPLVTVWLLSLAATMINPYGWEYWRYLAEAVSMPRPFVGEWHSVAGALQQGLYVTNVLYFLALVVSSLLVLIKVRPGPAAGLVLGVTAGLGFLQVRHTLFFLIAFAAFLPSHFSSLWQSGSDRRPRLAAVFSRPWVPAALLLLLTADSFHFVYRYRLWERPLALELPSRPAPGNPGYYYPRGAVEFLQAADIRGNVLPLFEWGEYLIWTLYPHIRVGMDGRYETVYRKEVIEEYFKFIFGLPGWDSMLNRYQHDLILIAPTGPAASRLRQQTGWKIVYQDEGAVLFGRH